MLAGLCCGLLKKRNKSEDSGVKSGTVLQSILQNTKLEGQELVLFGSGQIQMTGCCEWGNKPSGSIKCREFLELNGFASASRSQKYRV